MSDLTQLLDALACLVRLGILTQMEQGKYIVKYLNSRPDVEVVLKEEMDAMGVILTH